MDRIGRTAVVLLMLTWLAGMACWGPPAQRRQVQITLWHGMESGINNRVLAAKIDQFNRLHSDILLEAQVYGAADQLGPKLDAAVAGRTPPDLLWWAPAYFPKYAKAGVLRSVDDFIAQDPTFSKDDIYASLWELGTMDGEVYATPFSANNLAVYYNKAMFARAGIDRPPQTWAEFRDAAARLTRDGVSGFQLPIGTSEWTVWTWECFLWQAGGELLTSGKHEAAFGAPAGVEALDFWKSLVKDGSAVFSEADAGYKMDDLLSGRVAMVINGPWNLALLNDRTDVDVGVFPLPRDRQAATNIGGESLFLFRSDPAREHAAWEFMKFVMSPDFQVDWAIATGYLPVSKSAANTERYQAFLRDNPIVKVHNDQMTVGRARPSIPEYPAMSAILGRHIEAALYGKYSSEEALSRASADVDRLFQ